MNNLQQKIKSIINNCDGENFNFNEFIISGDRCVLVTPKNNGDVWNFDNIILRSLIYRKNDYFPVSLGLPKFFNFGENPSLYPNPESFRDWKAMEKLDGSLLIVSIYKGQLILRTRGTVDASKLEISGSEIEFFKKKYSKFFQYILDASSASYQSTLSVSYLFEWLSPLNKIVLSYPEADLVFLGIVNHENYSLVEQRYVTDFAEKFDLKRPRVFNFNSLSEMVKTVSEFKDMEGVCLYYNSDQNIVKLKGEWYCKCHKLKSELGSLNNVLDVYFSYEKFLDENEFFEKLSTAFDYEIASQCRDQIRLIVRGYLSVVHRVNKLNEWKDEYLVPIMKKKGINGRKDCAMLIFKDHKEYSNVLFKMIDGMDVLSNKEMIKKMMEKELDLI